MFSNLESQATMDLCVQGEQAKHFRLLAQFSKNEAKLQPKSDFDRS